MQRRFRRRRVVGSSIATDDRFELTTLGFCSILSALLSGSVLGQQISLSAIARGLGLGRWQRAPGAIAVLLALVALWRPDSRFSMAREFVPRFVYSGAQINIIAARRHDAPDSLIDSRTGLQRARRRPGPRERRSVARRTGPPGPASRRTLRDGADRLRRALCGISNRFNCWGRRVGGDIRLC